MRNGRVYAVLFLVFMHNVAAQQSRSVSIMPVVLSNKVAPGSMNATIQKIRAMFQPLQRSLRETAARGRARRAEETIRDKQIANMTAIISLLLKSPAFLRGFERLGISRITIDQLIKQLEVARLGSLMNTMQWAPRAWFGLNGGIAFMVSNLAMRLYLTNLAYVVQQEASVR